MAAIRIPGWGLADALKEEGLLPDDCVMVRTEIRADSVPVLVYELHLTDDRLDRFRKAFARYLEGRTDGPLT